MPSILIKKIGVGRHGNVKVAHVLEAQAVQKLRTNGISRLPGFSGSGFIERPPRDDDGSRAALGLDAGSGGHADASDTAAAGKGHS